MLKSVKIMYGYAGFLLALSMLAFVLSGFQSRGLTALYFGGGAGVAVLICAIMGGMLKTNRAVGMIGIHLGLVLSLLLGLALGWRFIQQIRGETVLYLATIFLAMSVGSLVAFALILAMRPKPENRV